MEFSIVEGKKLNSLNYMSDGYRYNKYNESNGTHAGQNGHSQNGHTPTRPQP